MAMSALAPSMAAASMAAAGPLAVKQTANSRQQAVFSASLGVPRSAAVPSIAKPSIRPMFLTAQAADAGVTMVAEDYGSAGAYDTAPRRGNKLYVGNLPWSMDSESLAGAFQKCGDVDTVEVIYDKETGRSRGFGFVTYTTSEDAARAVDELNGMEVGGRQLRVNFPNPPGTRETRSERPPRREGGAGGGGRDSPNKLYVGNLTWGMDDLGLQDLFSEYGTVVEAKVITDRDSGRSRGFGFVTMSNTNEVNEAIAALDGADVDGRQLRVNLASSKPSGGGGGGYGGGRGGGGGYGGGRGGGGYGGGDSYGDDSYGAY